MEELTYETLDEYLKTIMEGMSRGRLMKFARECGSLQKFVESTEADYGIWYKKGHPNGKYGINRATWNNLKIMKNYIKNFKNLKKKESEEAAKAEADREERIAKLNPKFTRCQLQGLVAIMELTGCESIDLDGINTLLRVLNYNPCATLVTKQEVLQ